MPKIKTGEVITWKEFFRRWGEGINGVTLLQQVKMQIQATWITLVGIICGIVVCAIGFNTLWWLMIILVGGLYNTSIQLFGLIQRKNQLTRFEAMLISDTTNQEKEVLQNV